MKLINITNTLAELCYCYLLQFTIVYNYIIIYYYENKSYVIVTKIFIHHATSMLYLNDVDQVK